MHLHSYIFGVRFFVIVSIALFLSVVFFLSPERGGLWAYMLFYLFFFAAATGMSMLALIRLWGRLAHTKISHEDLIIIQRQASLVGLLMVILVGLQQLRMLFWWDAIIVTAAILLIELFFVTREKI